MPPLSIPISTMFNEHRTLFEILLDIIREDRPPRLEIDEDEKDEKDDIRDEISWCPYAGLAARIRSKGVV